MPNYRDNQFISDWLNPQAGEKMNAPFVYPRRAVRHLDFSKVRDSHYTQTGVTETPLYTKELGQFQRGFMRNLLTKTYSNINNAVQDLPRYRLNFQFNPPDITQEVAMKQDIYAPILQDPAQFAQPMSAIATFNFDLLFDRTMEVGKGSSPRPGQEVDVFGTTNPATDVYQIGVLSDLQMLYAIIGQGFSNDMVAYQLEQIKSQALLDLKNNTDSALSRDEILATTTSSFSLGGDANLGNAAFLIPTPVRIVFSQLFMVDGFITHTAVRFTKFNTNMVPIQASVGLSMNALYIGFAKEKTFLTEQIATGIQNDIQSAADAAAASAASAAADKEFFDQELMLAASKSAASFVFVGDNSDGWLAGLGDQNIEVAKYALSNAESDNREFKVGFKDANMQDRTYRTGWDSPVSVHEYDNIGALFKGGKAFTISYAWDLQVYGPFSAIEANLYKKSKRPPSDKRLGWYAGSAKASNLDEWKNILSDSVRDNDPMAQNKSTIENPTIRKNTVEDFYDDHFVVWLRANVGISVGSNMVTKEIDQIKDQLGGDGLAFYEHLLWPVQRNNAAPVVPTNNYPAGTAVGSGPGGQLPVDRL